MREISNEFKVRCPYFCPPKFHSQDHWFNMVHIKRAYWSKKYHLPLNLRLSRPRFRAHLLWGCRKQARPSRPLTSERSAFFFLEKNSHIQLEWMLVRCQDGVETSKGRVSTLAERDVNKVCAEIYKVFVGK